MQSQTSEYIGGGALGRHGVVHAAGGEQGQGLGGCEIAEKSDLALLAAQPVALHLDEEPGVVGIGAAAKDGGEPGERIRCGGRAIGAPGAADRALLVAGERDEAVGVAREFVPSGEAGAFAIARVGVVFVFGVALRVSAGIDGR